jgi:phosphatidyl-myo-inositol dimannoside synthase
VSIYVDVSKLGLSVRTLQHEDALEYARAERAFAERYGKHFNFLTVSRLVSIKRLELQLAALKSLIATVPNALLHIVGNGPEEAKLKQLVVELGIASHVVFHGYQTGHHLGLFYVACDAFLLTSDYEGWGMVIIEAATAGLPVVMTDVGCAGELIVDEESGLVVPPGDTAAITKAMERMATDSALRTQLSVGALKALEALPSFPQLLTEYRQNWELALKNPL